MKFLLEVIGMALLLALIFVALDPVGAGVHAAKVVHSFNVAMEGIQ